MKLRLSLKNRTRDSLILINGIFAVILVTVVLLLLPYRSLPYAGETAAAAAKKMSEMISYIASVRSGAPADPIADPYNTGLIGPELSEITTTIGDPAAKRTTLNPAFASLIVSLLSEAGVRPGDTIAAGSSGSFPGLLIATLAASEALGVHPQIILSLGSSFHGASDLQFTILDLHMILYNGGYTKSLPLAVTPGGENDTGEEMTPETLAELRKKAERYSIPILTEPNLVRNRMMRDSVFTNGGETRIKAFINSGGGVSNMGPSTLSLSLKPGLVRRAPMPPYETRGVIHDMLSKDIPVIHLLYIRGLTSRYGIDWDSDPFTVREFTDNATHSLWYLNLIAVLAVIWFGALLLILSRRPQFRS
jgi:poly-gamma-glutamate system protein